MAEVLWPWLALAGLGALHGLNPLCGWPCALQHGARVLRPIALGHGASVLVVAGVIAQGADLSATQLQLLAGAMLLAVLALHSSGQPARALPTGAVGLALWSFIVSTAHGAGLMLVPALVPLCLSDSPARAVTTAGGSWSLALAAVAVHAVSMLAAAGAIAHGTRRLVAAVRRVAGCTGPRLSARKAGPGSGRPRP